MGAQEFATVDVVRLEVETDPVGLRNLVQNPNGDLGGWGWITPVSGSKMSGDIDHQLTYDGVAGASWFTTEAMPITAGQYAAARWDSISGDAAAPYFRVRFEWLNSAGTLISSSSQTGYISPGARVGNLAAQLAPAGTAFARLRFDMYKTNAGAAPTAAHFMDFSEVTVAKAATSGALGSVRANLMPNPSFETSLSGWRTGPSSTIERVSSPVAVGSWAMRFTMGDRPKDVAIKTLEGTGGIPVQGSTTYTLQFKARSATTPRSLACTLYWYTSSGTFISRESTPALPSTSTTAWTTYTFTALAPASAAYVRVTVTLNNAPAVGEQHYFDAFHLEAGTSIPSYFDGSTSPAGGVSYEWTTRAPVVTARTNLIKNPSFETNINGWLGGVGITLDRVTTPSGRTGTACLRLTSNAASAANATVALTPGSFAAVTPGMVYSASAYVRSDAGAPCVITTAFYNSGGTQLTSGESAWAEGTNSTAWRRIEVTGLLAPAGATQLQIGVRFLGTAAGQQHYIDSVLVETSEWARAYFDGATSITEDSWITTASRAWTGTANASTSTQTDTSTVPYSRAISSNLQYIAPVQYLNVIGDSHQVREVRDQLQVGTLAAEIYSAALDPATSDLIRPGRRARLTALVNGVWEQLIGGTMLKAEVAYELRDPKVPDSKRARITVTIADPAQVLANAQRPEGVATIDELPFVLEGAGVPWSVNNSGGQAPTADVTTYNEAASALTQVALTRDTRLGYAWISRLGVLTAWDAALLPSGAPLVLDESHYSDLDVSFSTEDCINELNVTVQSVALDGSTEETTYGPYIDQPSIDQWGRYKADFTVTGLDGTEVDALAAAVLAANGTPRRRVNSVTLPLTTLARVNRHALVDLYAEVQVNNAELGLSDVLRVTGREATIDTQRWLLTLKFTHDGGVAAPIFQPAVVSGVRPGVGKIDWFAGPVAKIPSNSLLCNGASYAVADYPFLHAIIGYTYGGTGAFFNVPNLVDRFPIGTGTKAVGTTGGSPVHSHPLSTRGRALLTLAPSSVLARLTGAITWSSTNRVDGTASATSASHSSAAALQGDTDNADSLPPWLSLTPIIQAI